MKLIPAIVAALALSAPLAACGEDEPAVCSSVNELQSSVDDVKGIDVGSSEALSDLQSGLSAVEDDLGEVKSDASDEFSTQIEAVEASFAALTSSVESAMADASVDTLAAARAALSTFGTDIQTLVTDVQETC
ncbi:hypothetical protein AB0F44_08240 [Nocardioides sp. NPDC023903]|uniref:hypothetical protein n=1 Tax=Nocardioides sp. NPDC023903 TaxID=3157195 RepID=UPI0033EAC328